MGSGSVKDDRTALSSSSSTATAAAATTAPMDEDPQLRNMTYVQVGAHVAMYRGGGSGSDSSQTLYVCTHGNCSFRTHSYSTNLRNHLAEHFGDRPFICGDCEYRSERFDSLRKHCRVHTGERPYACPVCGYRSKTNSNLHAHIRTKHNMPSGKAERMPSICAQYDTTITATSAVSASHNMTAAGTVLNPIVTGGVTSSVGVPGPISFGIPSVAAAAAAAGSPSAAVNGNRGHNASSSGGEASGSSPESGPRYHEVPISLNTLPIPMSLSSLSIPNSFHLSAGATQEPPIGGQQQPEVAHQKHHRQRSGSNASQKDSAVPDRQPLDYSMGVFGVNRPSM